MALRRLDQLLSSLGYVSRRSCVEFVKAGRVRVGEHVAERSDERVDPAQVFVDDEPIDDPGPLLVLFHKPVGYICTHAEDEGETIYDLLPERWARRNPPATSIGRLDKDTSGVLIITDQGAIVQRLTSPKSSIAKVYDVTVDRDLHPSLIRIFASGTLLLHSETKPCLPANLEITGPRTAQLTLTEGRYHQVRRMFASQGYEVVTLHRSRFGKCTVDGLAPGEWRTLESI